MGGEIPSPVAVLSKVEGVLAADGRAALCQIVRAEGSTPGKPGWRLLVRYDGATSGNLGGGAFEALVVADARAMLAGRASASRIKRYYFTEKAVRGEPTGMVCGGMAEVFLEVLVTPPLCVVCGGGPVGQALARASRAAGFEVLVAEDRPAFRSPDLFPPDTAFAEVDRDYGSDFLTPFRGRDLFVAVVTRCWETDTAALTAVVRQDPPHLRYLGLMGSRRKIERVREGVRSEGGDLSTVDLKAPIGLPIGGDSPGEIAVAVVAEMIQERYRDSAAGGAATGQEDREPVGAGRVRAVE